MQGFTSLLLQENQNQMEELESGDLEALSTNELLNYIIYHDALIYPSPPPQIAILPVNNEKVNIENNDNNENHNNNKKNVLPEQPVTRMKRKRRRRAKVCKNKEEAETQRMTHIAVERNRRKQMNGHLAVLRSLMPDSYIQRGDQASIVGGAIEYVKELEHLLQTLESQKLLLHHSAAATPSSSGDILAPLQPPFSQFFSHPQYTWTTNTNTMNSNTMNNNTSMVNNNYKYNTTSSSSRSNDLADIEVSLIETHANVRILSRRSFSQLSKMVAAFHSFSLSILHLNVTTLDPLVLYSISVKVEEGCQLTSADDIAGAVHHMLRIIEEEAAIC